MTDLKISQLTAASVAQDGAFVPVADPDGIGGYNTRKLTIAQIKEGIEFTGDIVGRIPWQDAGVWSSEAVYFPDDIVYTPSVGAFLCFEEHVGEEPPNPAYWQQITADGAQILTGEGAPSIGIGADGDIYIDVQNSDMYGPKAAGVWGSGISLTGSPGLSAYEVAVVNGFVGSEESWLLSLEGEDGVDGIDAPTELEANAQTGATYTLALSDALKFVSLDNADPVTVTVPANAAVAFPVGTQIIVGRKGAGAVTIDPATGVDLNGSNNDLTLGDQWSGVVTLWKYAADEWWVFGGLA